jgi:hypothetical protein
MTYEELSPSYAIMIMSYEDIKKVYFQL